jgi:hypothetical protein
VQTCGRTIYEVMASISVFAASTSSHSRICQDRFIFLVYVLAGIFRNRFHEQQKVKNRVNQCAVRRDTVGLSSFLVSWPRGLGQEVMSGGRETKIKYVA